MGELVWRKFQQLQQVIVLGFLGDHGHVAALVYYFGARGELNDWAVKLNIAHVGMSC